MCSGWDCLAVTSIQTMMQGLSGSFSWLNAQDTHTHARSYTHTRVLAALTGGGKRSRTLLIHLYQEERRGEQEVKQELSEVRYCSVFLKILKYL